MDVDVCSTHVPQVEGVYMDSIRVIWYTMKLIYDTHKEIWWAQANADERMTWDDSTMVICVTKML
jgi:hypothetical protein